MATNVMETWLASSHFSGGSATYIEGIYESYLEDPLSVDANWRKVFDDLPKVNEQPEEPHSAVRDQMRHAAKAPKCFTPPEGAVHNDAKQVRVLQLISAYRN
ncbi:MAG: 2-oxoglutarate dehydrogenase E1 component, partial [Psychromonas sp.]